MGLLTKDNLYIKITPCSFKNNEEKNMFTVEFYKSLHNRQLAKISKSQQQYIDEINQLIQSKSDKIYNELYISRKYSHAEIKQIKSDYLHFTYKNLNDKKWCIKNINELINLINEFYIYRNINNNTDISKIKFKYLIKFYPNILDSIGNISMVFNIGILGFENKTLEDVYNYIKAKKKFGETTDC